MDLSANLQRISQRVARACARAGRDAGDITLIAVTKSVDAATIESLIELGVNEIGENRQQAASDKLPRVANLSRARLHFIGPLQRNKVRRVLELFQVIHSVDSFRLAQEISRRAEREVEIFIEVNVAGEAQKQGLPPAQAEAAIREIIKLPGLRVRGLMCMAPYSDDAEAARPYFRRLAALSRELRNAGALPSSADQLSMGMSGDFEVAIEEGATHVRIGTALFEP
jgi:PLP dependent protein